MTIETAKTTVACTNGHIDPMLAALVDASMVTPDEPETGLLDQLAQCPDDKLKSFALSHANELADLPRAELAMFCEALQARGVAAEWVRRELKPAINDERKRSVNGATWTDYVQAAERLGYTFALNELDDRIEVNGHRLSDVLDAQILSKLHAEGLRSAEVARRALMTAAAQNTYHPVKNFFACVQWDGRDHIAHLAAHFTDTHEPITYSDGTQRTVFHAWLRRWLVGAVAKVETNGLAQNPMLIVDGVQGAGKSFFAGWICPLDGMHFEGAIRPDDKDYFGYLTTRLVWEVSELGATMRKADQEALKAFVTLQEATYRPAYGRHPLHKPALASFIGTVNFDGALLSDQTGHRRFHPVELTGIDWRYSETVDVRQVWAQAHALYKRGEPWRLTDEERQAHMAICERYAVEDVLAGHVAEWFDVDPGNGDIFTPTTRIIEHLRTYAGAKENDKALSMKLAGTLNRLKLRNGTSNSGGGRRRGWFGIAPRDTRQD